MRSEAARLHINARAVHIRITSIHTQAEFLISGRTLSGGTQIRRNIGFDPLEFFRGERKFVPAFEELTRAIAWDGRVAAEKNAVHSDLAHSPGQQRSASVPTFRRWECRTRQNKDAGPGNLRV